MTNLEVENARLRARVAELEGELEALKLANARLIITVSNLECCIHDIDENSTMGYLVRIQEPYDSLADGDVTVATVTAAHELIEQQEADNDVPELP